MTNSGSNHKPSLRNDEGSDMLYSILTDAYTRIEATTKRLEITSILVDLLRNTPSYTIEKLVYLTQGQLYPDYEGIELGVAEKLVIRTIANATGKDAVSITSFFKKEGDLGTTVEKLLAGRSQLALSSERLTVEEVYNTFDKIARAKGAGSTEAKVRQLTALMGKASPQEAKYVTRMAVGKLRLGVADMTILDALSIALGGGKESRKSLERAYNLCSDLGQVAKVLLTDGLSAIENFEVSVGKPIRPMLAERLSDPVEILEKMKGEAVAEYKYDGLRIQAHISHDRVSLFSRRLENITDQFPDVQKLLKDSFVAREAIVEGEAVPVDPTTGDLLPFQLISQRRGRKYELEKMIEEVPVAVFLFDLLFAEGEDYTQQPYPARREALQQSANHSDRLRLASQMLLKDAQQLDEFMAQAVADGCEGLMVKSTGVGSFYNAGARGWSWIKYKRDYKSEMRDTVDLAVVGAFSGRGRRGGTYGALLLAAYDEKEDVFKTVCKCGSGFKDADLEKLPEMLEKYRVLHKHARVDSKLEADAWFLPGLVLEVIGSEITLSPIHTCGMNAVRQGAGLAIRFPRFTGRYRDDKAPEQATSTEEVVEIYGSQLKRVN